MVISRLVLSRRPGTPVTRPNKLELCQALIAHLAAALDELRVAIEALGPASADPITAGYALGLRDLAATLAIGAGDVSVLVRAFGVADDPRFALVVHRTRRGPIVSYNERAIDRLRELIVAPPSPLDAVAERARQRALRHLR